MARIQHSERVFKTWVDETELSQRIGVSLAFLRSDRMTRLTGIPFVKLGRRVLYSLEDVEAFLESRMIRNGEVE